MGKSRFAMSRRVYSNLDDGSELPTPHAYSFCVNPLLALKSGFEYLTNRLDYRPGLVRNVTIDLFRFDGLPVYSRGGLSISNMFKDYKASHEGQPSIWGTSIPRGRCDDDKEGGV
jgi:hypothetical protein